MSTAETRATTSESTPGRRGSRARGRRRSPAPTTTVTAGTRLRVIRPRATGPASSSATASQSIGRRSGWARLAPRLPTTWMTASATARTTCGGRRGPHEPHGPHGGPNPASGPQPAPHGRSSTPGRGRAVSSGRTCDQRRDGRSARRPAGGCGARTPPGVRQDGISPARLARSAAWTRSRLPVLASTLPAWVFTVLVEGGGDRRSRCCSGPGRWRGVGIAGDTPSGSGGAIGRSADPREHRPGHPGRAGWPPATARTAGEGALQL